MTQSDSSTDETDRVPMLPWCRDCWDQAADGTQQERNDELPDCCERCGSNEVFWI